MNGSCVALFGLPCLVWWDSLGRRTPSTQLAAVLLTWAERMGANESGDDGLCGDG